MKIYTKTGDNGDTGLVGGLRISKGSDRVEAYGDVDELVSFLGVIRSLSSDAELLELLGEIQLELFFLNTELATPSDRTPPGEIIEEIFILRLEKEIDRCDEEIPPLRSFILPGGSPTSSYLQVARTICRRAERSVVRLAQAEAIRAEVIRYLNRLSDLLFSLGRRANLRENVGEVYIRDLRLASKKAKEGGIKNEGTPLPHQEGVNAVRSSLPLSPEEPT